MVRLVSLTTEGHALMTVTAWMTHLGSALSACPDLPALHTTLLCVDPYTPWTLTMPHHMKRTANSRRTSLRDKSGSVVVDSTASTYTLHSTSRIPLSSSSLSRDLSVELCFIPEADGATEREEPDHLTFVDLYTGPRSQSARACLGLHVADSPSPYRKIPPLVIEHSGC